MLTSTAGIMRQGSNSRRPRSRGNGKRHSSSKNQNFESNGPDVKVRGTAQQVLEKYLALARDAASAGDRVASEGYYQHAEHYFRLSNIDGGNNGQRADMPKPAEPDMGMGEPSNPDSETTMSADRPRAEPTSGAESESETEKASV